MTVLDISTAAERSFATPNALKASKSTSIRPSNLCSGQTFESDLEAVPSQAAQLVRVWIDLPGNTQNMLRSRR